ncbi:MAG: 3-phosphoglycerate dehydrogenase, partial [Candidatus Thiodiazotropha taylori]|nr:3-phosphoglycerate dehydrogenase [Candidatus Thiodiazotropha taylori]MCW4293294.1 3-phosphoglycerate dehydrogenase [Candidatus Thiodiazotropha taylori]
ENGNITNSVNFPSINLPRNGGHRIAVVNNNVPNMVGQISTDLANEGLNILDMLNKSRDDVAVTLLDVDQKPSEQLIETLSTIEGVLSVRSLNGITN